MGFNKAVFLDRDGTINIDQEGYINNPERFELFSFAANSIRKLNKAKFRIFIVSNQSGIARGYYTEEELSAIHAKMIGLLKEADAFIDEIFYSPYHKKGKIKPFNIDHENRKPGLGMFKAAQMKYGIDVKNSFMIGDKYSDIEFGKKAGLKTILVLTGNGEAEFRDRRNDWQYKPDIIVKDLSVAANIITKYGDRL